jgi:cob(I)alamin adenosyltransferase
MVAMAKRKIYTRVGDKGKTSLANGKRVPKDSPEIQTLGAIDEFNASIGVAVSSIKEKHIVKLLQDIQNDLLNIGAEIGNSGQSVKSTSKLYPIDKDKIVKLESFIDLFSKKLPDLQTFIVPSGKREFALLNLSRTVCRRAERDLVLLSRKRKVKPDILAYFNRLSDFLFVLTRYLNKGHEKLWERK